MNIHTEDQNQIDIEEAILKVNSQNFDEEFHGTENTEEATVMLLHNCSDESLHDIEAKMHHQIDPSYQ